MIPRHAVDLAAMEAEAARQSDEALGLLRDHDADTLAARPDERRWSVLGHIAHTCIVNERYLEAMGVRIVSAIASGPRSEGPYRHPWIAAWFARSMEPPPTRRYKTQRKMVPDPAQEVDVVRERFTSAQEELIRLVEASRGLDLGRVRFGSPFLRVLRFSLGTGFEVLLAHNRRHIWLAHETLSDLSAA